MKPHTLSPPPQVAGLKPLAIFHFMRLLVVSSLCCLASPASAIQRTWTGSVNANWSEPGNWNPAGPPTGGDRLLFRAGDSNRDMINDLTGLSVNLLSFGFDGNDHDYQLSGNPLTIGPMGTGANILCLPDGSSILTINCPLVFTNGGRIIAEPMEGGIIFHQTAEIRLNAPITINQGHLYLQSQGTDVSAGSSGTIRVAAPISGNGDLHAVNFGSANENLVEFSGSLGNTFAGTLFLSSSGNGSQISFNKTSGSVVTNRIMVHEGDSVNLKLNQPNQIGANVTISLTNGALKLMGQNSTIKQLDLLNDTFDTQAATLDTGATTVTLLGGFSSTNYSGFHTPSVLGKINLSAGDHLFTVAGTLYEGVDFQAQIEGSGGFSKWGNNALSLKGANTFSGTVNVLDGIIDAYHASSFGSLAGGIVLNGGSVSLRNLSIIDETLFVRGHQQITPETAGSLLTSFGVSAWTGAIQLDTNLVVSFGDMTLSGSISGPGGLALHSGGTVQLGGPAANTFTGTTLVRCPVLELNKPFGLHAYAGPLVVGSDGGGPYEVRWLNSYQNPNTPLTLYANGVVNLAWSNAVENFGPVTFNGGTVQTGTGFFIAENTITANPATTTATVNGNLSLGVSPAYFVVSNGGADPDLLINAAISGAALIKQGAGTLRLAGANTYSGLTTVNEGIFEVGNNAALGSASFGTIVNEAATLRLNTFGTVPESFALSGAGVGGTNGVIHVTGNPSVTGSIFLNGPSTINVAPGAGLAIDSIISGTGPLTKAGSGNLFLGGVSGGTGNNTYSGSTVVTAGTLYLSKNQGVLSVPGPLIVGPGIVASPATARFSRTGTMPAGGTATVNANSLLDLNNNNQTLSSLNLNDGGDVQTGAGQLNFAAGGVVTVGTLNAPQVGLLASSSISGKIGLPELDYLTFNVGGYGPAPLVPDAELVIPALISGGGNIIKNGPGTMLLSGANTFNDSPPNLAGDLLIYGGIVIAANSSALGGPAGWTLVYNGARLALVGNITVIDETLYLNSTNNTTLDNPGGHNIWLGPIIQARDSSIGVNLDWSLTVAGTVSGTGSLTKKGAGLLRLGGSANNTHSGDTFVDAGSIWLTKFPNMQAVPANLMIGRPEGGSPATVMHVNSDLIWGNVTVNNGGLLNVNGYDEYIGNLTLNGGGDAQTGAGTLHLTSLAVNPGSFAEQSVVSGRIGLNAGSVPCAVGSGSLGVGVADCLVSATIIHTSHAANLAKTGAGLLQLTGNNTYSGNTTVSSGTVQIDGLQPQSPVQVFGGRLQGSGTVGHVVFDESKCFLAPGSSPGILTTSNFNANALGGGKVEIELNGLTVGSGYDQINVRGTVNLTGLALSPALNFASVTNDQFTIINNDGAEAVSGTFAGLPQNMQLYVGGELFQINYSGGTGNDVVLTRLVTPPRPTLTIERIPPASVRLVWPTNGLPFRLHSTTNLNPSSWTLVSPPPSVVGTNNVVANTVSGVQMFYRLVNP